MPASTKKSLDWDSPATDLKGVGPKLAEKLKRLNLYTLQDILFHLPHHYQDRTSIANIGELQPGDERMIEAIVDGAQVLFRRRRSLLCQISDDTGSLNLRFFYFSNAQKNQLIQGTKIRCFGEVRRGASTLEIIHPEYQLIDDKPQATPSSNTYTPIFPSSQGISQSLLRNIVTQALAQHQKNKVHDWIPKDLLPSTNSPDLVSSLQKIHFPPNDTSLQQLDAGTDPAKQRLAFEELVAHRLAMLDLRQQFSTETAFTCLPEQTSLNAFFDALPFSPTTAQHRVINEISADLKKAIPMHRLLQGDVGSGKTLVAAAAIIQCIQSGYQAALMAPTEILASQHYKSFQTWFESLNIHTTLLTGQLSAATRKERLDQIQAGEAQLVIGTHAIFQKEVAFNNLCLIIIDEQHRFGVDQRLALRKKGDQSNQQPHQLIMTATPIPRTLSMTIYADLDCSIIDELPPGRKNITTIALPEKRRDDVIERIRSALTAGKQVYWVCTLIDESETLQCQTAQDTAQKFQEILPDFKTGLIHGRLKSVEKESLMSDFKTGKIQLLVATTVIEVGVDVPNASLIIIENAERLGLSQLHQLRGRVGRGHAESTCVLIYKGPLNEVARKRLSVMRETNDGFVIAEKDLEIRGSGELMGIRQTGAMQFRVADLVRDSYLLDRVQNAAAIIQKRHPEAIQPLIRRWIKNTQIYARV